MPTATQPVASRAVRRGIGLATVAALVAAAPAQAAGLRAGVGRSDVTPPTGYPTMGYVRDDARGDGQSTRLYARAIVLQEGGRRLALVTTDLGFTPGGLLVEVASRLRGLGFSERNLIISASHTHSGPAGYANFQSDNFVAPTEGQPTGFEVQGDTHLYGFLIERIVLAVQRADQDLGPARAGWGTARLLGVTDNRSLEAHLANFGIDEPVGSGRVAQDPGGYPDTIDPNVDVLRVDRVLPDGRSLPLGGWLNFADHGTVDPYQLGVYAADHHGVASRIFEAAVRRAGHVPSSQDVVGAYGNSDAGDMTAALRGRGPAYAEVVGRREAAAMLRAWRRAGRRLAGAPAFATRWTRSCFCGRTVQGGAVADQPAMGMPFLTGSEENRGPLFDVTGASFEGDRLPVDAGPQGRKVAALGPPEADFPHAVPLMVVRLGDRVLATVPGEATVEMGRRIRAAVLAAARPLGVTRAVVVGYANEYVHYFTTPQEYEQQAYEGGSTLYGKYSSNLIMGDLATLAGDLAGGAKAPAPYAYDPRNGVVPDTQPFGAGAAQGVAVTQPATTGRIARAEFAWRGETQGLDRPLDRPFVTVERRVGGSWRAVTDDLGLQMLWRVDAGGQYTAQWQVPLAAPPGTYRFAVTANRYGLTSAPFAVVPSTALRLVALPRSGDRIRISIAYPPIEMLTDLTSRPARATAGRITAQVGGRSVTVGGGPVFTLPAPAGATVRIAAGAARDRFGNRTGVATVLAPTGGR